MRLETSPWGTLARQWYLDMNQISAGAVTVIISNNLISGNDTGIALEMQPDSQSAYTIASNLIGTNAAGTAALGNTGVGMEFLSVENATVTNNVISGNGLGCQFRFEPAPGWQMTSCRGT